MPGRGCLWNYSAYCAINQPNLGERWWRQNQALYDAAAPSADKYLAAVHIAISLHHTGVANDMMAKPAAIAPNEPLVLVMKKNLKDLDKSKIDNLLGDFNDPSSPEE